MTDAFDPEDLTLLKATSRDLEGATERHKHPAPARKPRLRDMGFWFDPEATPHFDWMIEIDLSVITPIISGARRPQDTCPPAKATPRVDAALNRPYPVPPDPRRAARWRGGDRQYHQRHQINTSDPYMMVAAGLLARKPGATGLLCDKTIPVGGPLSGGYSILSNAFFVASFNLIKRDRP